MRLRPAIARLLVFPAAGPVTTEDLVNEARALLSPLLAGAPIGGGTDANFAELNRNRECVHGLDLVSWAIHPQVHAFDDFTIVENLAAQAATVRSARQFCGAKPLSISPVTFRSRATAPDPRLQSGLGAAWFCASLKHLAEAGIASATYFTTAEACAKSPLHTAWSIVAGFEPEFVLRSHSSKSAAIDGIVLRRGDRIRLVVGNFTPAPQRFSTAKYGEAMLDPYAMAFFGWKL